MKKFIIFLLLFLSVIDEVQSQQNTSDSLHLVLQNAPNDTIRMDVFNQLAWYYYTINYDSARLYWGQSLSIAQKLKLKLWEAGILSSQAYDFSWSNYPKSLELFLQALKIAEDPSSEKNTWNLPPGRTPHDERLSTLSNIYFSTAQLYGNTGNTEKQISNLKQAGNLAESLKDSGLNLVINLNLGTAYLDKLKKLDSALYFEQKALSFFSKSGNGNNGDLAWVFGSIGAIYLEKRNFNQSENAFKKGLQLMQEQNNLAGISSLCFSLSKLYKTINKPDSSLLYAYKALETYKRFNDKPGIADAFSSISSAYEQQKRIDSAFAYLKLAASLHDSLNKIEKENLLTYQNKNLDEQMRVKNLEEEKTKTQTQVRIYALLSAIFVCMLIAFLLYRNNRHRKKANELLAKQKEEIEVQKKNVEATLIELKSTQQQLIQSEKMASLGELTAGIAHEIQNPLNFVNNFSEVNKEMIDEATEEIDKGNIDEVKIILDDIKDNSEKINHHGKRADAIVKGMLQHSRSSSGIKEPTDINKLCDEYLRLSYHGLRAKDKEFNVEIKTDFDESISKINIVPQDIGRVLLNLYNNAFYAVNEKWKAEGEGFKASISVRTKKIENSVHLTVSDNGNGILQKVIDKIFQPFFTTKPTGQGTGLGLSLSYDIIKAHSGEIKVISKEGEGSQFSIQLPI